MWVNRWICNWFCFSSTKDCKCSVNGSVGCHSIGMCICKGNYGGNQCQHCKLNSIFQIRLVLILSLLAFMPVVILRDAFKRTYFSQRCVFCCVTYYKNIHFPENIEWTNLYTLLLQDLRMRKVPVYYFFIIKSSDATRKKYCFVRNIDNDVLCCV